MKFRDFMRSGNTFTGVVGLEVETESMENYSLPRDILRYWNTAPDGSLRQNGVEYTFLQPYTQGSPEYIAALNAFDALSKTVKFLESSYTSVHVHLNMLDKELVQVFNFIALYYIFEELLTEYCGKQRNGNLFCLKSSNAEFHHWTVKSLVSSISLGEGHRAVTRLHNENLKYSGLNIVPLRTFGSLEVRTHPGTTNIEKIDRWVSILMCLFRAADKFEDPVQIVEYLNKTTRINFLNEIFREYVSYLNTEDLSKKVKNGIWYATVLARATPTWKNFGEQKLEKKPSIDYRSMGRYYREAGLEVNPNTDQVVVVDNERHYLTLSEFVRRNTPVDRNNIQITEVMDL